MNLIYDLLSEPYVIEYGEFHHITIENLIEFRRIMENIENNEVIRVIDNHNKDVERCFINDFLQFNFSDRKITNKVYKDLLSISGNENFYLERMSINEKIRNFIAKIIYEYDFPLQYNNEFDIVTLFKSYKIGLDIEFDGFLEKVLTIIQIYKDIFQCYFFTTYNIEQFLNDVELKELLLYLKHNQLVLLNFSRYNVVSDVIIKHLLIDNDLCRVL